MKNRTKRAAAIIVSLFCLMFTPYVFAADRDNTILPYSVSVEKRSFKELSSTRYTTTSDQNVKQDTALLAAYAIIDYTQSVSMFYGSQGYREMNPLLGSKPTRGGMIAFGVISVGLFYLVSDYLSEPWRQIFADSILASERINIEDNRRLYKGSNTDGPPIRGRSFNGIPIVISFRL